MIKEINSNEIDTINELIDYKITNNSFEKCFKYELDNKIIGIIDFSDIYERIELNYIWISPIFRGNNYSKELMNYMFEYAKNKKINNITLEVSVNNEIAIKLYQKYGFTQASIRKNYYNGTDAFLMIRKFDKDE